MDAYEFNNVDCHPSKAMLPSYMEIILHALRKLKNGPLRVIELSIYRPRLLLS